MRLIYTIIISLLAFGLSASSSTAFAPLDGPGGSCMTIQINQYNFICDESNPCEDTEGCDIFESVLNLPNGGTLTGQTCSCTDGDGGPGAHTHCCGMYRYITEGPSGSHIGMGARGDCSGAGCSGGECTKVSLPGGFAVASCINSEPPVEL